MYNNILLLRGFWSLKLHYAGRKEFEEVWFGQKVDGLYYLEVNGPGTGSSLNTAFSLNKH